MKKTHMRFLVGLLALCIFPMHSYAQTTTPQTNPAQEKADREKQTIINGEITVLENQLIKLTDPNREGLAWVKEQFTDLPDDTAYNVKFFQNADQVFRTKNPNDYLFIPTNQPTDLSEAAKNAISNAEDVYTIMIEGTYADIKGTQSQKDRICDAVIEHDINANKAYEKANQLVYVARTLSQNYTNPNDNDRTREEIIEDTEILRRRIAQQKTIAEFFLIKTKRECLRGKPPTVSTGGILPGISAEDTQKSGNQSAGLSYVRDKFLPGLANTIFTLALALSVVALILIGMMFVFSELDKELLDKAKQALFWLFIGLIVLMLSFAIVKLVLNINLLG